MGQVLKVEADDPVAEEDITRWAKRAGHEVLQLEVREHNSEKTYDGDRIMSKILYVQTSGLDTSGRLYAPFILGMTARAMDAEASIFFMIKGITAMKKGEAEKIKIGSFPSLKEVIDQALASGVKMYICEQSTQLLGIARGEFIPEAKIAGAGTLNDLALDADSTISF